LAHQKMEEGRKTFAPIPEGIIPVFFKSNGMIALVPEERIRRLILQSIYDEMLRNLAPLVQREVNEQMALLRDSWLAQRSLIGISLTTILLAIGVVLSTLSFVVFDLPDMGILFVYAAIAALGGMLFILYRSKRERM